MPDWLIQANAPWWVEYLRYVLLHLGCPFATFIHVQFVKMWRIDNGHKPLNNSNTRLLAAFSAFGITFIVAAGFLEYDYPHAFWSAVLNGIFYPVVIAVAMNYIPWINTKLTVSKIIIKTDAPCPPPV